MGEHGLFRDPISLPAGSNTVWHYLPTGFQSEIKYKLKNKENNNNNNNNNSFTNEMCVKFKNLTLMDLYYDLIKFSYVHDF